MNRFFLIYELGPSSRAQLSQDFPVCYLSSFGYFYIALFYDFGVFASGVVYNLILDWRGIYKKNLYVLLVHENAYLSYCIFWGTEVKSIVILYIYDEIYSSFNFRPVNDKTAYPFRLGGYAFSFKILCGPKT